MYAMMAITVSSLIGWVVLAWSSTSRTRSTRASHSLCAGHPHPTFHTVPGSPVVMCTCDNHGRIRPRSRPGVNSFFTGTCVDNWDRSWPGLNRHFATRPSPNGSYVRNQKKWSGTGSGGGFYVSFPRITSARTAQDAHPPAEISPFRPQSAPSLCVFSDCCGCAFKLRFELLLADIPIRQQPCRYPPHPPAFSPFGDVSC